MQGIKDFNFPAFHLAASKLREAGHEVFNPAERDETVHGIGNLISETGNIKDIVGGFSLRKALQDDTGYICKRAEAIAMLPGWEKSNGARAEWALALALGLEFIYL